MDAATGAAARPKPPVRVTANLFSIGFGLADLAACWQAGSRATGAVRAREGRPRVESAR
jgi:hypothetical protein